MQNQPSRRSAASWVVYDVANSAFPLVMITAVFVIYFKNVIVGGDNPGWSDFLWGMSISISAGLVALISPIVGAFADVYGARKRILLVYTILSVVAVFTLSFAQPGMIAFAMCAFILANAGYEGGVVMYGSLLPFVTTRERIGRLSGIGWSAGYIGGLICLLLTLGLAMNNQVPMVLRAVSLWFAFFSIPLFLWVPEAPANPDAEKRPFRSLVATLKEIWRTPSLRLFFIAYFIYNDAIVTVFAFSSPFAIDVLGFTMPQIIKMVIGVQITAAIGAFGFGLIADHLGHGKTIVLTLGIWVAVTACAFVTALELPIWANDAALALAEAQAAALAAGEAIPEAVPSPLRQLIYFTLAQLIGFSMGATQSCSRAFLAAVAPSDQSGRLFGFFAIAGRFSAVVGPALFGVVSLWTGSKAWSVLTIVLLFALGMFLMTRVTEDKVRDELASWK